MRTPFMIGLVLVVLGVGALLFSVIPIRHSEPIARIGPIVAVEERTQTVVIPPYLAVLAILAGGVLMIVGRPIG